MIVHMPIIAVNPFILFAPLTPRTSWVGGDSRATHGTAGMRHSAGWEWILLVCGVAAILSLATGRAARPRVAGPVFGAAAALAAFATAAAAAGGHWLDAAGGGWISQGS